MPQPKVTITKDTTDRLLQGLSLSGLLVMVVLTLYYWNSLPDTIPTHFGATGQPDAYGSKNALWTLVGVGAVVFFILNWTARHPEWGNYPVKITEENASDQYHNMIQLSYALGAVILLGMAYIHYASIQSALGNRDGLGLWFLLAFLGAVFGLIIYHFSRAKQLA